MPLTKTDDIVGSISGATSNGAVLIGTSVGTNYDVWRCSTCGGFFLHPSKYSPFRCPYCKEMR